MYEYFCIHADRVGLARTGALGIAQCGGVALIVWGLSQLVTFVLYFVSCDVRDL